MELDMLILGEVKSCLIASMACRPRRVEVCGFGAKRGSWKTGQNGELASGSCAVGRTVSSPLRSLFLRCPLYSLETWTCARHHRGSLVPGLPGGSTRRRDAQSLIWACALIRGVASWSSTPWECPSESVPCRASYWESGDRFAVRQFTPAPGACSVGPREMVLGPRGVGRAACGSTTWTSRPICPRPGLSACSAVGRRFKAPVWHPSPGVSDAMAS